MSDKTPKVDELEKGTLAELCQRDEAGSEEEPCCQRSSGSSGTVFQRQSDPLETRWNRGCQRIRWRGHRKIQRCSPALSECGILPHDARESPRRLVLQHQGPEKPVRRLGEIWQRTHQPPWFHRGHHSPGHDHPQSPALFRCLNGDRIRSRRLRIRPKNAHGLCRTGPVRVVIPSIPWARPQSDDGISGGDPSAPLAVQVQDQDLRMSERLRGCHRPIRFHDHRHLAGQPEDRSRRR